MEHYDAETQEYIKDILKSIDGLLYGFADVSDAVDDVFKHLPKAITIAIPLTPAIVDDIADAPTQAYYDEYLNVNEKLDEITKQLTLAIKQRGYLAYGISSSKRTDYDKICGEFPHKTAAVRGGLGWIGKSSLLITRKYGPRIRLSTVLTDMPLETNHILEKNYCGTCKQCTSCCPAKAILGNTWSAGIAREKLIDVQKCDVWKINNYSQFHGHVCGRCVAVCPHGRN